MQGQGKRAEHDDAAGNPASEMGGRHLRLHHKVFHFLDFSLDGEAERLPAEPPLPTAACPSCLDFARQQEPTGQPGSRAGDAGEQ